jgi:cbb3-type cytochrome oxidase subunit 3
MNRNIKKRFILLIALYFTVVLFNVPVVFAANGVDCQARGGWCDKACLTKPSIGGYDCPSGWQCCGDPSQAGQIIFGTGQGSGNVPGEKTSVFDNPLGQNMGTVDAVLASTSGYLNAVAGTIAIIFVLVGSAFYIVAGFGKKEMAELGKKMIVVAIGGFAVVVAAPAIWLEIKNILGGGSPEQLVQTSPTVTIVTRTLRGFLYLVGLYAILGFLIGGIAYLISFGDEKRMDRAKAILKFVIIGSLFAVGALVLASQIAQLLGG